MSTFKTSQTVSTSSAVTEKLGEQIGKRLRGSEVIELVSDLGGGKTTFVRGLAQGAGSKDQVASPSFTISRQYDVRGPSFHKLVHLDFYRLNDAGVIKHELADWLEDPLVVVVVEWADVVRSVLPADRLTIKMKTIGDNSRKIIFEYPDLLAYLMEGIC